MKKLLYLFLLFPIFLFAQPRYGVEGIPMCWKIGSIDSNITRYVIISSTGSPVQTIAWENAAGQVINVSGGYLRYGYCDCAGSSGSGGNGIYGGSGTLPNALVQVQNTQGIKFVEPGTQNGILIANKANGAAGIALDPVYTDSIRQGLVWKQGTDSAAVGIDKDGRLQLLSNNWVAIGNDQAKIIIRKDDAVVLIKTGNNVYALADGVPLSGKNNVMLWPNGSGSGRFANLDSLVDGRAKRDTFITVPPNTNYFQNSIDYPSRFYNNIYLSCKGRTDTSFVAFLGTPIWEEQKGVTYNVKNDSGFVAAFVITNEHFSNSKRLYVLKRGQTAQVRLLPDAANPGQYGWAVNVVWDSVGGGANIYTASDSIAGPERKVKMSAVSPSSLQIGHWGGLYDPITSSNYGLWINKTGMGGSSLFQFGTGVMRLNNGYVEIGDYDFDSYTYKSSFSSTGTTALLKAGTGGQAFIEVQPTRLFFKSQNGSMYLPDASPSNSNGVKNILVFTGDGSDAIPSYQTLNNAITGSARSIPYMNTGGRFYAGNTYFKLDTNTTSGAQAKVRLLINNPNGTAGEGDSYSVLSVRAGDGPGTEAIFNIGDQAATMGTTGYNSVFQLYRSRGTFEAKSNLLNGDVVGSFTWRGQANGGSQALGNVSLIYTGDGITTRSQIVGTTTTAGGLISGWKLDDQSRFWLGSGADDYYFPTISPSTTANHRSKLVWSGTGLSTTPAFKRDMIYAEGPFTPDANGDVTFNLYTTMPLDVYKIDFTLRRLTGTVTNITYQVTAQTTSTFTVNFRVGNTGAAVTTGTYLAYYGIDEF